MVLGGLNKHIINQLLKNTAWAIRYLSSLSTNGLAVWFCKPTTPLQSDHKLLKAYKLYRLLCAGRLN